MPTGAVTRAKMAPECLHLNAPCLALGARIAVLFACWRKLGAPL